MQAPCATLHRPLLGQAAPDRNNIQAKIVPGQLHDWKTSTRLAETAIAQNGIKTRALNMVLQLRLDNQPSTDQHAISKSNASLIEQLRAYPASSVWSFSGVASMARFCICSPLPCTAARRTLPAQWRFFAPTLGFPLQDPQGCREDP